MGGTCSSHSADRNANKITLEKCDGKKDNIQINLNKKGAGAYRIRLLKLTMKGFCRHDK
jgi:hypothetical protein